jgi:hypothetical protein
MLDQVRYFLLGVMGSTMLLALFFGVIEAMLQFPVVGFSAWFLVTSYFVGQAIRAKYED